MLLKISRDENKENALFVFLVGIGLIAYYLGIVNMYVWIGVLFIRLFTFNRVEVGFFSLLFGSSIFGRLFALQSLYIYSIILFLIIGIVFLHKEIIEVLNTHLDRYVFFIILISFFLLEYIVGPQTDYSKDKIIKLIVRGVVWMTAFLIYVRSESISSKKIGVAFLIVTLYYLSQSAQLYHIHPSSLFDINFFRKAAVLLGRNEFRSHIVNYHTLAYLSLSGCTFWMLQKDFIEREKKISLFVIFFSFWIVMMSGARQGIVIFILLFTLRYMISRGRVLSFSNIMLGLLGIALFYVIINSFESTYFNSFLTTDDVNMEDRLHRDTTTPLEVMRIEPLAGVGFGGYPLYANKDYPHNFFLEIVCELGVIGLLIISMWFTIYYLYNKRNLYPNYLTANQSFWFLFFIFFFCSSQISGDLASSMKFIALLLSFVNLQTEEGQSAIEEA